MYVYSTCRVQEKSRKLLAHVGQVVTRRSRYRKKSRLMWAHVPAYPNTRQQFLTSLFFDIYLYPTCARLPRMYQQFHTFNSPVPIPGTCCTHCEPGWSVGLMINIKIFTPTSYVELFISYQTRSQIVLYFPFASGPSVPLSEAVAQPLGAHCPRSTKMELKWERRSKKWGREKREGKREKGGRGGKKEGRKGGENGKRMEIGTILTFAPPPGLKLQAMPLI